MIFKNEFECLGGIAAVMNKVKVLKSVIYAILVLSICICSFTCVSAATGKELALSVETKQVTAGSSFDVTVSITENPGIAALRLSIAYDTDVLTLTDVKDAGLLGDVTLDNVNSSPYKVVWINGDTAENITSTGKILTLTFKAKNITEETSASVNVSLASANDCLDKDLNKVTLAVSGGDITVSPAEILKGDVDGNGIVDEADAIRVLYYYVDGGTYYPVNQSVDFDGNGVENSDDAVYLLYYSLFGGEYYPLLSN